MRLWDLRRIGPNIPPVQTYASHVCQMYPICGKFLCEDQFIVTGSEDNAAYIYETLTGAMVRKVELGCPVTQTEPVACNDLSFYVILYRNQQMGLVDAVGEDLKPELPSVEEQRKETRKTTMQTTLMELSDQIYQHLRVVGRYNMVGYGNLLEALQSTAQSDESSRRLLAEIQTRYESKLAQSYVQLPNIFPLQRENTQIPRKTEENRAICMPNLMVERRSVGSWPPYFPSSS